MTLFSIFSDHAPSRLVQAGTLFAAVVLVAGCGSTYRSVITPIGSSGPAPQPQAYAIVVSAPSPSTPGIATVIDYSGDTTLAYAPIGPGPSYLTINQSGTAGFTLNSDGTLTTFPVSTQLQAKQVTYSTLNSPSQHGPPHAPENLFVATSGIWAADLDGNYVDIFVGAVGVQAFELAVPVAPTPVMVQGPVGGGGQRNYALTQGTVTSGVQCNIAPTTAPIGEVDGIEFSSLTVSSTIPVGRCPVYAVESPDNKRFFVLNRGDDTITVINSQNNALDTCTPFLNQDGQLVHCHPTLPLSITAVNALNAITPGSGNPPNGTSGMPTVAGPVYAEYNAGTSQLVIADYDGNSVTVIDVSLDVFGNDSQTFGTTFTIPVGVNPASVTALYDGSRAYTANQADCTPDCITAPNGTVSIVNLVGHTLEKTLPVTGLPRTVVSNQNSQYGKVYVASPNSPYITIIRTDLDIIDTTVLVEGNTVDVRSSGANGVGGNTNVTSRNPGYGQPCNLPAAVLGSTYSLADCQTLPPPPPAQP